MKRKERKLATGNFIYIKPKYKQKRLMDHIKALVTPWRWEKCSSLQATSRCENAAIDANKSLQIYMHQFLDNKHDNESIDSIYRKKNEGD